MDELITLQHGQNLHSGKSHQVLHGRFVHVGKTSTDLQILSCELYQNAFGGRTVLMHGTPAAGVSQTAAWYKERNYGTLADGATYSLFDWAAITLGIGPHFYSCTCTYMAVKNILLKSESHIIINHHHHIINRRRPPRQPRLHSLA